MTAPPTGPSRQGVERRSFRRTAVESPSEYDSWGFPNRWGGFHRSTDAWAYWRTFLVALYSPKDALFALRWARQLWRHRRCDTVDFHHYACTLDPWGKRAEANYQWHKTWCDKPPRGHMPYVHETTTKGSQR